MQLAEKSLYTPSTLVFLLLLVTFVFSCSPASSDPELSLHTLKLPSGFTISVYASSVPNASSMTLSPKGTLFVGTREDGKVYAVVDRNQDNQADAVFTIARGLNAPNGVAFRDGALYVAEINRV